MPFDASRNVLESVTHFAVKEFVGKSTMLKRALVAIILAGSVSIPTIVSADDTGLAGMHAWRKVGKKTCFVDHYHDGAGAGDSKAKAEKEAIQAWAAFTALEYGSDWGSWSLAVNKSIRCDRITSEHKCNVSAIPCKGR